MTRTPFIARCNACSIAACIATPFAKPDGRGPTSYFYAKVWHKIMGNSTVQSLIERQGKGDAGWLLVCIILEARRIGESHGTLCDRGYPVSSKALVRVTGLEPASVRECLDAFKAAGITTESQDGIITLCNFDGLQYDSSTLRRRNAGNARGNERALHAATSVPEETETELYTEIENKLPPNPPRQGGKRADCVCGGEGHVQIGGQVVVCYCRKGETWRKAHPQVFARPWCEETDRGRG